MSNCKKCGKKIRILSKYHLVDNEKICSNCFKEIQKIQQQKSRDNIVKKENSQIDKEKFKEEIKREISKKFDWYDEILKIINQLNQDKFTLNDLYIHEDNLKLKFPNNHHIKEKIRQKLRIIRDQGKIEFLGNGNYRKISNIKKDKSLESIKKIEKDLKISDENIIDKQKIETFASGLRKNIEGYEGTLSNIIHYTPSLYELFESLLKEKTFDNDIRSVINSVVAYFVLPDDIIPEDKYGVLGYIDDLYLCVYILEKFYPKKEIIEKYWKGEEKIFDLAKSIKKKIENTETEIINKKTLEMTRNYIEPLLLNCRLLDDEEKQIEIIRENIVFRKKVEKEKSKEKQIHYYNEELSYVQENDDFLELIDRENGLCILTIDKDNNIFMPKEKTDYKSDEIEKIRYKINNEKELIEYDSELFNLEEKGNYLVLIGKGSDRIKTTYNKKYYILKPKNIDSTLSYKKTQEIKISDRNEDEISYKKTQELKIKRSIGKNILVKKNNSICINCKDRLKCDEYKSGSGEIIKCSGFNIN